MLAEIVAMVAVDDEQGALEPGLASAAISISSRDDVVGVADGVEDALLDGVVAGDVERGLGRAERVVVARRDQGGDERPLPAELADPRRGVAEDLRGRAGPPAG